MTTCSSIIRAFTDPAGTITLDETARHRRRMAMVSDNGISFLLDLPEARHIRHGDGLLLDDGRVIKVVAEAEELLEIRARDRLHLIELAWHIGNRHLAAQIEPERVLIRRDHVIEAMLEGLGATVAPVVEIFEPVGGAYSGHAHGHEHHHHHD
ncbi:urease accessory protein UreE [Mesorhizobium xinjiangense]|uniref:urease accessory protein UreE n=1 Tax=Mesorhizobium xinjiangense TaxID=2678685 RepID=UPI0012ED5AB0|nr:urease accessory protein UreE [Mesorhizobium xinjiangense]